MELADIEPGMLMLEPSAGRGAIALPAAAAGATVDCCEVMHENHAHLLAQPGLHAVTRQDFLTVPPEPFYDRVVMNPPFHTTRDADPGLGIAFLRAAQRGLSPSGVLWLVANRHLPYDRVLAELFRTVEDVGADTAFRLIRAAGPIRTR